MARLDQLPEPQRSHIAKTKLPKFDKQHSILLLMI